MSLTTIRAKLKKRKPPAGLTERQGEILLYCLRCLLSGYMPTIREIGEEFDITSPNGVMGHLNALRAKGFVERAENRGLQLTDTAMELVF